MELDQIINAINPLLNPLGYEAVHVEVQSHKQKTLRVFIDFLTPPSEKDGKSVGIGIEDCVAATRALDEPLDQIAEVQAIFHGPYELEVSSPGVDRPLRQLKDFMRFTGREAKIHTFRPLTAQEIGNASYFEKNPKQKKFIGTIAGAVTQDGVEKVLLAISDGSSADKKRSHGKSKTSKERDGAASAEVGIPLPLISKANLEPKFEIGEK